MTWTYKQYLNKIKSLKKELSSDDLTKTANEIETLATSVITVATGVLFGPSFLLYRFAKFFFESDKPIQADSNWMYWAGQIILPACAKKGIVADLETMNPGNSEERNVYFCFNLPITTEAIGESILREVRNRIANTFRISVLDVNHIYDLSISKGQLKICRKEMAEPQA